jgi:hypothetical protein
MALSYDLADGAPAIGAATVEPDRVYHSNRSKVSMRVDGFEEY